MVTTVWTLYGPISERNTSKFYPTVWNLIQTSNAACLPLRVCSDPEDDELPQWKWNCASW